MKGIIRFRKIWLWAFFIGFVLFLLSSNSGSRPIWNPVEQLIIEATAPFQKLITQTVKITRNFWLNYFDLVNVRSENKALKRKNNALRMENNRYRELLATHQRLQELLQFSQTSNRPVLAAQVIGRDPTGWFESIIIDKGRLAGLKVDMPVVNASGVVGRTVSVSPDYAKILLIIDQNSAVDCLIQRSRDRGMVRGSSTEICKLEYVVKSSDVAIEDIVVTSGLGGVFPKGLPVGQVSNVKETSGELFKDIRITPAVDFSKLEEVLIILREEKSLIHQNERE
ncbi:MAG: rod shape-determining protein MreC [Desulfobacteraceae bacterium]|nr:rod shape-determining protein MreC [Desulfobacteraceae bacterium]